MNILLVSPVFPPEIGSSAQIYYDLAQGFLKRGHNVHVLTSYPRDYNLPANEKEQTYILDENTAGIWVHRARHHAPSVGKMILRGLEHFYMPLFYFNKYKDIKKKYNITFDVCIIHSPPLPFCFLAKMIKRYDDTPSIMNYQDFHPGELVEAGIVKNIIWIKALEAVERWAYKNADYITSHSIGGVDFMISRGANPQKITTVFNVVDLSIIDSPELKVNFKSKEGIDGKYLISFAGRILPDGGYDKLLNLAESLINETDVIFYIVGNGPYKEELDNLVAKRGLSNVVLRPFVPRDEYIQLVDSSDMAWVSLDKTDTYPCLPGKLLNLMALKKPILGFLSPNSEAARIINLSESGVVISTNNISDISKEILFLKSNPDLRIRMGNHGRKFVEENMTPNISVAKYEQIINEHFIRR